MDSWCGFNKIVIPGEMVHYKAFLKTLYCLWYKATHNYNCTLLSLSRLIFSNFAANSLVKQFDIHFLLLNSTCLVEEPVCCRAAFCFKSPVVTLTNRA